MAELALVDERADGAKDTGLRLDAFTGHLLAGGRAERTAASYRAAIGAFASWHREHEPLPLAMAAVTPLCVRAYRDHLRDEQRKSASTIDVRLAALRAYLLVASFASSACRGRRHWRDKVKLAVGWVPDGP